MKLPIKSIFAGAQGLIEYDLHDADGVYLGSINDWSDVVRIVEAVNNYQFHSSDAAVDQSPKEKP